MNRNTVRIFCKMLDKVATEANLSDTPENIFNTDDSGIQINNKPDSVIREKGPKVFMSEHREKIVSILQRQHAVKLPPVVILKDVNRKQDFSDFLPQ